MNVSRPVNGIERLLKSLNCDGKLGLALLAACAVLLLPVLAGDAGREALRYDRAALAAGQWWRLLTAHFVHLDFDHAALNSLGLVLMWALFARDYRPRHWLAILIGAIAAIDAGLWLRDSTVAWYVGSSGVLHGIMAAGTLAHLRRRDLDGWILAVFIVVKLVYEQSAGALPFTDSHSGVVVDAHLFGTLGGAGIAAFLEPRMEPL
ncbi:MAG TPA: rhombosortase [Steroidobacteraceae bacterium]|jgi:rhomboid family GlyGly-CTERM serine protease|nr:rhombosortase [Steroidobacteraceae bacterium]